MKVIDLLKTGSSFLQICIRAGIKADDVLWRQKRKFHSTQILLCKIDMHGEISYEIIRELTDGRKQFYFVKKLRKR